MGAWALYINTTGSYNVSIGEFSSYENLSGNYNVAVGRNASRNSKAGDYGVSIGYNSQYWGNTTTTNFTNNNTSVGAFSLMGREGAPLTGTKNTAVGFSASEKNSTGIENAAFGQSTLLENTSGSFNSAFGAFALGNMNGANNNTAIGTASSYELQSGTNNTSVGTYALRNNVSGVENIAVGSSAGVGILGSYNIAIGIQSMEAQVDYINSVAVGYKALNHCKGNRNTAVGSFALEEAMNTGDTMNTAVGHGAAAKLTTAQKNTSIGAYAGYYEWINNYTNRQEGGNFNNCTNLGYLATPNRDNQVNLGNHECTTYYYNAISQRSDERDKADIRDTHLGLDFIKLLRPVDFRWDYREAYFDFDPETHEPTPVPKDGSRKRNRFHHGLIAQEVKEVADAQGVDFAGYQDHKVNGGNDVLTIGYTELIAPLIKAVQELSAENEALKARLDAAGL